MERDVEHAASAAANRGVVPFSFVVSNEAPSSVASPPTRSPAELVNMISCRPCSNDEDNDEDAASFIVIFGKPVSTRSSVGG